MEVEIVGTHSTDDLIQGVAQYFANKNKLDALRWLHEVIFVL